MDCFSDCFGTGLGTRRFSPHNNLVIFVESLCSDDTFHLALPVYQLPPETVCV